MVAATELTTARKFAADWLEAGRRVVAATLVERIGSAPLDSGAEMVVDDTGRIEGTVTGGCVESALVAEAEGVLRRRRPRLVSYGISDAEAAEVGLMCGGTVSVFVHELPPEPRSALVAVSEALRSAQAAALATLLDGAAAGAKLAILGDATVGSLGAADRLDEAVAREARGYMDEGLSRTRRYGSDGEVMASDLAVYVQAFASRPELLICGAIDYSIALARIAREVGYRVTIVDARAAFARGRRFSDVADVVVNWPDRELAVREPGPRDAVLVFTHDPKFDEPALVRALRSDAGYVGALGSRRTQAERLERLRAAGLSERELARLHSPCGLDLGARTPEETAVSILAELIAARTGRSGASLSRTIGPIHTEAEAAPGSEEREAS